MSQDHQSALFEIVPSGDYLQIVCVKCRSDCELDFKGLDPSIPLLEITCPKCGTSGDWKLDRAGQGFYARTHDRKK